MKFAAVEKKRVTSWEKFLWKGTEIHVQTKFLLQQACSSRISVLCTARKRTANHAQNVERVNSWQPAKTVWKFMQMRGRARVMHIGDFVLFRAFSAWKPCMVTPWLLPLVTPLVTGRVTIQVTTSRVSKPCAPRSILYRYRYRYYLELLQTSTTWNFYRLVILHITSTGTTGWQTGYITDYRCYRFTVW